MACIRHQQIDLDAYLADPRAAEWQNFRDHFPGCDSCTSALASLTRFENNLRDAAVEPGPGHPDAATLYAFESHAAELGDTARSAVEDHLGGCARCRDSLAALAAFDFATAATAGRAGAAPERSGRWAALWPLPTPILAGALVAVAAFAIVLPLGDSLWPSPQSSTGPRDPLAPLAQSPAVPEAADALPGAIPEPAGDERATQLAQSEASSASERRPQPAPKRKRRTPPADPIAELWADFEAPVADATLVAMAELRRPRYKTPDDISDALGRIHEVTRSARQRPDLRALAPEHVARTLRAAPRLYWSASAATGPVAFTLVDDVSIDPVLELMLEPAPSAGIYSVALASHGVSLEPGRPYRWFVALPGEGADSGHAVLAGAAIERVEVDDELRKRLSDVPPERVGHKLARAGLWYDALEAFSRLAEQNPEAKGPRVHRNELLRRAGVLP